jgi:hypothetical protein
MRLCVPGWYVEEISEWVCPGGLWGAKIEWINRSKATLLWGEPVGWGRAGNTWLSSITFLMNTKEVMLKHIDSFHNSRVSCNFVESFNKI